MITTGPTDPTPQPLMQEQIQTDVDQLLRLITTLQYSYTSNGVLAWLLSKNEHLHRQAPIQVWLDGERQSVLSAAELIGDSSADQQATTRTEWACVIRGHEDDATWYPAPGIPGAHVHINSVDLNCYLGSRVVVTYPIVEVEQ